MLLGSIIVIDKITHVQTKLVIFKSGRGQVKFRGDSLHDTLWATQAEIAGVFGVERSVVTKHLQNIYIDGELSEKATCAKFAQVQIEGKRSVEGKIECYNLDVIISVEYRVNSKTATKFRKCATSVLKSHITDGFTINRARIAENYPVFMEAVETLKKLAPA